MRERLGSLRRMFALVSTFFAIMMLGACANPSSIVQDDALTFKNEYPGHIQNVGNSGRKIQYAWSGDPKKRPLLFVHGSPGSWEGWAHFLNDQKLRDHFQVISVDRPGYGGSEPGETEPSLEAQAEQIAEVLKTNESGLPAILVGHSFGGPVIAQMAMSYPDKVAGLVFVASSVSPDLESTKWFQYPASWWPIRILIPTDLRVCNEEILPLKGELTRMLPKWSSITAKAVLIQGEDDPLVPPANLDFLIKHLRPELIVKTDRIPGLNHFIPWKRPDLIFDGIWDLEKAISK
jgi:pimeloyl-ACP methyl ester carboxylesterase